MANTLKGKSTVFLVFIAPIDEATPVLRSFFENHYEFEREKSHENGLLKLVQYHVDESPECKEDNVAPAPFFDGKFPNIIGRTVFVLTKFMKMRMGCTIISLNPRKSCQNLMRCFLLSKLSFNA